MKGKPGTRMQGFWWRKRWPTKPDVFSDMAWDWYTRHVQGRETLKEIAAADGVPVSRVGKTVRYVHNWFEHGPYQGNW